MGIIKFKLLFIISSLVLALLPVNVMANTLQPGQNFNNESTEEQNESVNDNQEQQQNDDSEPSGENGWTEPEESYDDSNNNGNNNNNFNNWNNSNNYNNDENYYDGNNNYNNGNENYNNNNEDNWSTPQETVEQYEEPVQEEPVIEEPVEPEYEEPIIEEPVEEVPMIEEPVEIVEPEPSVDVNTLNSGTFSISGEAVDEDGEGIKDIELILSGESFDEQSAATDEEGGFLFEEVPSGNYRIEIKPTEDYEVSESTVELEVTDRSKRGLKISLTSAEEEEEAVEKESEPVKTDEDVMAAETSSLSSMDWTLIGTGIVFALISLFVLLFKKVRKN